MSKFVAVFENNHCPLEHENCCHIVFTHYGWMEDCDGMLDNRPKFCPLKEYKNAIPIEWINQWQGKQYCLQDEGKARITVIEMLEDWEKENE